MYKTITPEQAVKLFWSRVNKKGPIPKHCPELGRGWEWLAGSTNDGYGLFGSKPKVSSHRYSWELANGQIPDGLFVLHKCDNPRCVNPSHLFLGTHGDNMNDLKEKNRKRGHPAGYKDETKQRMQAIIDFVADYAKTKKIAPTLKEIAVGVGLKEADFGNVAPLIDHLVEEGFLTRAGWHQGRSIAVADKPPRKRFYTAPKVT